MNKPHIAFLGLGIMGGGMARRLLGAGFPLTAYNRNPEKTTALAKDGAKAAHSPREAAAHADVIISMLADDVASRGVWLGNDGALAGARAGAACIECSTLSLDWVRELAAAGHSRKLEFLDAPVTGTKPHAANGELTFLVGGDAAILEKLRPVFTPMAKNITHIGPVGSGAIIKLINNFVCGVQVASLAEAMAWIERSGLDRAKALEVLMNGAPGSPLFKQISARMTAPDFTPNFLLKLMTKDLQYAVAEGKKISLPLETAEASLALFRNAITQGDGDKDMAAVVEQFRKK